MSAMRRLARRLPTLCSVISLLLCIALSALWVRSYFHVDRAYRLRPVVTRDGEGWSALGGWSDGGKLTLARQVTGVWLICTQSEQAKNGAWGWHWHTYPYEHRPNDGGLLGKLGFQYESLGPGMQFERHWYVGAPHWFLILLLAALPVARVTSKLHRRRRIRHGLCPSCGYDLRGTPDRCPECGQQSDGMVVAEQ